MLSVAQPRANYDRSMTVAARNGRSATGSSDENIR
jgi:hypothetical protein